MGVNINSVPYMIKDMSGLSTQTFTQAYNAVATQLRSGVPALAVNAQPWFETTRGAASTAVVAAAGTSDIVSGAVANLFLTQIDPRLIARGQSPVTSQQFQSMNYTSSGGWSDYNALFFAYHQRALRGLTFDVNYTWSRLQDTGGRNQDSGGGFVTDAFNVAYDYGDAVTDRRHVLATYGTYQLPFARERPLVGGWSVSFVLTAFSGLPISVAGRRIVRLWRAGKRPARTGCELHRIEEFSSAGIRRRRIVGQSCHRRHWCEPVRQSRSDLQKLPPAPARRRYADVAGQGTRVWVLGCRLVDRQIIQDAQRHAVERLRRFLQRDEHRAVRQPGAVDPEPGELRRRHAAIGQSADSGLLWFSKRTARREVRVLRAGCRITLSTTEDTADTEVKTCLVKDLSLLSSVSTVVARFRGYREGTRAPLCFS